MHCIIALYCVYILNKGFIVMLFFTTQLKNKHDTLHKQLHFFPISFSYMYV